MVLLEIQLGILLTGSRSVRVGGFQSIHSMRLAMANAPERMPCMPWIVLGFSGRQTCAWQPARRQS
jgi:hypothetical protein